MTSTTSEISLDKGDKFNHVVLNKNSDFGLFFENKDQENIYRKKEIEVLKIVNRLQATEIETLYRQVDERDAIICFQATEIETLYRQVDERDAIICFQATEIETLYRQVDERDAIICLQATEIKTLKQKVETLDHKVVKGDAIMCRLEFENEKLLHLCTFKTPTF